MDFKECARYIEGVKREGSLFRCKYDPETEIAIKNNWAGCWCMPDFVKIIDCPIMKLGG